MEKDFILETNSIVDKPIISNINPSYVMKKLPINKDSIKLFDIDEENRRMIRPSKVNTIFEGLNRGIHFNSPFVVNERIGRFYLIDGNHRYEAIKLKLSKDKEFEISVWFAVYRDLTKDEEKEIFKLWNLGVTQTANDFLKLHFSNIKYGEEILKNLPVTVYGTSNTLNAKLLIGSHIVAKKQLRFNGGYGAGKEKVVNDFMEIDKMDILTIKEFCNFMFDVFGVYNKDSNSKFYTSTPLPVFYRIWFDNHRIRDKKRLQKAFTRVFANNYLIWKDIMNAGGRGAQMIFYSQAIDSLKRSYPKLNIQSDVEILGLNKNKNSDDSKV